MAYLDIVASMVKGYRQSIIYNINNDDLETSAGVVEVYHGVLTAWLQDEETKLTEKPTKPIFAHATSTSKQPTAYKFSSTYRYELFDWLFDNLEICESGFANHLYNQKQMFPVMQVAVQDYRNALLYQLQKGQQPRAAIRFVRIMNKLLPEDYRVQLKPLPQDSIFSDGRDVEQREWCIEMLKEIDKSVAVYVQALKFLGST